MVTSLALRTRQLLDTPLISAGASLMASVAVTQGLGFLFWIAAARLFSTDDFGVGSTSILAMMQLAEFAHLGLKTGIMRFIPRVGNQARYLIARSYVTALIVASVSAAVFLVGINQWAPNLNSLVSSAAIIACFVAGTATWVLFILEDGVLVATRQSRWVPVENGVFGLIKIGLLFPFAVWVSPEIGIFLAWVLPVFPIVVVVNLFLRRVLRRSKITGTHLDGTTNAADDTVSFRSVLQYSGADWLSNTARFGAVAAIPFVVLSIEGKTAAGIYNSTFAIASGIYLLSQGVSEALLAESGRDGADLNRDTMRGAVMSMAITVPAVVIAIVAAPLVLAAFGPEFAEQGTTVVRLMLLGAIPNVVFRTYLGRLKAEDRMVSVILLEVTLALCVLAPSTWILRQFGLTGLGIGWLAGLSVVGLYALAAETLWWWAGIIPTGIARRIGSWRRAFHRRLLVLRSNGLFAKAIQQSGVVPVSVRRLISSHNYDRATAVADGNDVVYDIRIARTDRAASDLSTVQNTLTEMGNDRRISGFHRYIPSGLISGSVDQRPFLFSGRTSGPTGVDLLRSGVPLLDISRTIAASVSQFHVPTSELVTVDGSLIETWVRQPSKRLGEFCRAPSNELDAIQELLTNDLSDISLTVSRLHGSLALQTTVFTDDGTELQQLVDWRNSGTGPTIVDQAHLVTTSLATATNCELGLLVRELLADPTRFVEAMDALEMDISSIPTRAAILLAWLQHASVARYRQGLSDVWTARNVKPVLNEVKSLHGSAVVGGKVSTPPMKQAAFPGSQPGRGTKADFLE